MTLTRLAALLTVCLICSGEQETPTFRAGTTLIEFTFVAVDGEGNPVTDLKKEEISVTESGKNRDVVFFQFIGSVEESPRKALPPGTFSNRAEYAPGPPRNITALVLDTLNTEPMDQVYVRAQVLRYLRTLAPDTRVAVYRLGQGGLAVIHDFTDDLDALRARISQHATETQSRANVDLEALAARDAELLQKVVISTEGRQMLQEALAAELSAEAFYTEAVRRDRVDLTLALLEALGSRLAGIPGRKNLVWITSGIPALGFSAGWGASYESLIRRMAQRLATQGTTIYPVDAKGLEVDIHPASKAYVPDRLAKITLQQRMWATMDIVAGVTGGRVSRNSNDLTQGASYAAADVRGAYAVGFYAVGEPDDKWHRLDVKVVRRGVKLSHQQGYLSALAAVRSPEWSKERWLAAISNPIGSTAVRLDAQCQPVQGAVADTYDLLLQVASADLHFRKVGDRLGAEVDIVIAEKTEAGQSGFRIGKGQFGLPAGNGSGTMPSVFSYRQRLTIQSTTATVRLIFRDRSTDRCGTLDLPVKSIPSTRN